MQTVGCCKQGNGGGGYLVGSTRVDVVCENFYDV